MGLQSNIPPSAEEELVLKPRLKEKIDEIRIIEENIAKARETISSATEALDILTRSSVRARATLSSYAQKDMDSPISTQEDLIIGATELSASIVEECRTLSLDCGTKELHESPEVADTLSYFTRLEGLVAAVDDALRRQRLIINVTACSIKLYSLARQPIQEAVDEIQERFSVIKRVPDEVWYEVLTVRISQKSHWWPQVKDSPLSVPALFYSHVCRSWRRVVFSSPSMWRAIHWNMGPEKEPNRDLIDLWLRKSPENERRIYERQSYSDLAAAGSIHMKLQLPIHEKLQYYLHQTRRQRPYGMEGDESSTISLPSLFLQASKSSTRIPRLQANLIRRFTVLESLHLQDMLPRDWFVLPSTLTHLVISFAVSHEIYDLPQLLRPSLESLKMSHFNAVGTPVLSKPIDLPKLRTLDITPLEHDIAKNLILPALEKLFVCPPRNSAASWPAGWLASLIPHCSSVTHLRFDWPSSIPDTATPSLDRLQVFFDLRLHTPKLRTLKFSSGSFSGGALADFLGTDQRGRLEKLTMDGCRGVSRMDCERLVELVDKLSVYRTVHGLATGS